MDPTAKLRQNDGESSVKTRQIVGESAIKESKKDEKGRRNAVQHYVKPRQMTSNARVREQELDKFDTLTRAREALRRARQWKGLRQLPHVHAHIVK